MQSSSSLLISSSSHLPTSRNWESSLGKLLTSYGFSGSVPSVLKKSSKSLKSSPKCSQPSLPSIPSTHSPGVHSPKDYEASFGHLSSIYGFGGGVPSLPPNVPKQPKSSVSSSQPRVVRPPTGKDYEASFGQLSSMYGFGSPVPLIPNKK